MFEFIKFIQDKDPAHPTFCEVIFSYPGFHSIFFYKVGNFFWNANLKGMGRFVSHLGRFFTGIEIHPQAFIGKNVFIDHGMGVVIGQTAIVEECVVIYHGATLGGRGEVDGKRHPTIKRGAIIGAGAKILGNVTIGENAVIGANAIVLSDVADGTVVVGVYDKYKS